MWHELAVILVLVALNGVFSGAEIAILSLREGRLLTLMQQRRRGARFVDRLRSQPEGFLATVQVGITVVGAAAAAFGGSSTAGRLAPSLVPFVGDAAEEVALGLVVAMVSFLSLVLGELVPKSLALRAAETYALLVAPLLVGMSIIMRPLVWVLTASSNVVLRLFGDSTSFLEARMSLDEVRHVVEKAGHEGDIEKSTSEMASRALHLGVLRASDVMVPRSDVVSIREDAGRDELEDALVKRGHSRVPVVAARGEECVGYVSAKDVLARLMRGEALELPRLLRPAHHVPATMPAAALLEDMRKRKLHIAFVVDDLGSMRGLVTMEDLVEEVVGEIFNEHDSHTPEHVARQPDGAWLVNAQLPLREVNRALGTKFEEGPGYTTLGGLCLVLANGIPAMGTVLHKDGVVFTVHDASARRVRMVRVELPPPGTPPA